MQTLDIEAIKKILPHRYPFLLVDRIIELDPGLHAVGLKNVTANEHFFEGHFPTRAIMPGVLLIEIMAQVGGIMTLSKPENREKLAFIATLDKAKFRRPVTPGDQLIVETTTLRSRGNNGRVQGEIRVNDNVVAEAEIMFVLINANERA